MNAFEASALAARPTTGSELPNTKVQSSVKNGVNFQLPVDVERVPNTRIHSIATRRDELVGGVSGEKDPSTTVALSNEQMRVPGIRNEDLEWKRTFREAVNQRGRIDFLRPHVGREKCMRGPDVPIVLRDHCHL
jgi:hypothetical protein